MVSRILSSFIIRSLEFARFRPDGDVYNLSICICINTDRLFERWTIVGGKEEKK